MALKPETNAQLDIGLTYQDNVLKGKISAYASHIANYIVLDYNPSNPSAFNTNAMLMGGEIEAEAITWEVLHFYASLAYTYGENLSSQQGLQSH